MFPYWINTPTTISAEPARNNKLAKKMAFQGTAMLKKKWVIVEKQLESIYIIIIIFFTLWFGCFKLPGGKATIFL